MEQILIQLYKVIQQLRKQLPIGIWGAKEAVAQWAILRSRKRSERVNRSKQRVEASVIPAAPTEIAEGREQRPWRTKYVRIATMLRFSWGAEKKV